MRHLSTLSATLLSLVALSPLALADTLASPVGTYTISGQSFLTGVHASDNATINGTVTFDSNSVLTAANISLYIVPLNQTFTFTAPGTTEFIPQYHIQTSTVFDASNSNNSIDVDLSQFADSNGVFNTATCGTDCHPDASIPSLSEYIEFHDTLTPLASTPVAATPEPSSLALLGTGALGVFTTLRRRIRL